MYIAGADLGQSNDPTAICIIEAHGTKQTVEVPVRRYSQVLASWAWTSRQETIETAPATFQVRHLERPPLGTSYPAVAERVRALLVELGEPCTVAVDATGVGRAVVDIMRELGLPVLPIVITGGNEVGALDDGTLTVPKPNLVSIVAVGLQTGRLRIAKDLRLAELLATELQDFRVRVTPSAHAVYSAREGRHDDLVLATALAMWTADAWFRREQAFVSEIEGQW